MIDPARELSELHALHQRARAIRDRLESGPKTLANRLKVLATRQAAAELAAKQLKDSRAHTRNIEVQLKQIEGRIDDLKTKLNQAKKQAEYDGIKNNIAHENAAKEKIEDQILQAMESHEAQAAEVAQAEKDAKTLEAEIKTLETDLASRKGADEALLKELEAALAASEAIIPAEQRDQYRRVINQRTSDAMAAVEQSACTGCYVEVTHQMMNELINQSHLLFCRSCGRVLYLAEKDLPTNARRGS